MEGAGKMSVHQVRWITAAVAAGLLAAAAIGQAEQEKPETPATERKAPQTGQQATEQAGGARDSITGRRQARDVEESAPGKSVRMQGRTGGVSDADRQAWRQALTAEAKYRKRLAMVRRYRELAEQSGDKKRVIKADYLENKIEQAHQKAMERARQVLGDQKFNLIKARIEQGRQRRGPHGKGASAGKGRASGGKTGPDLGKGQEHAAPGTSTGTATGAGRGRTGAAAPATGEQDPKKRSPNRGETGTGRKKAEDS
jgi:hypothetical protein